MWSQAGGSFHQGVDPGVVDGAVEGVGALADRAQEYVGAAVGLVAGGDADGRFLVVGIGAGHAVVHAGHGGAAALGAVFAVAEADDGVRRAVGVLGHGAGDVILHHAQHARVAGGGLAGAFGVAVQHQG